VEVVDGFFLELTNLIKDIAKNKAFPAAFKELVKDSSKMVLDSETLHQKVADWAGAHKGVKLLVNKFPQQCKAQKSASLREHLSVYTALVYKYVHRYIR
jgi:hypothetical protein